MNSVFDSPCIACVYCFVVSNPNSTLFPNMLFCSKCAPHISDDDFSCDDFIKLSDDGLITSRRNILSAYWKEHEKISF